MAFALLLASCAPPAAPSVSIPTADSIPTVEPVASVIREGSAAPGFTLKTLDGGTVSLSDYLGRPVFINFWASWCGPCRTEMPAIIAAYAAHKDAGLEVLAVNATQLDLLDDVKAFVAEFKMPFAVLLDEDNHVIESYSIPGLPSSVFVDARGIVRGVNVGPMTPDVIEKYLADVLPAK